MMLRYLIRMALLIFVLLFVIVWWQTPDETTKSDVLDLQTAEYHKAERNADVVMQRPTRREGSTESEAKN